MQRQKEVLSEQHPLDGILSITPKVLEERLSGRDSSLSATPWSRPSTARSMSSTRGRKEDGDRQLLGRRNLPGAQKAAVFSMAASPLSSLPPLSSESNRSTSSTLLMSSESRRKSSQTSSNSLVSKLPPIGTLSIGNMRLEGRQMSMAPRPQSRSAHSSRQRFCRN